MSDLLYRIEAQLNTPRLRDHLSPFFTQTLNWGHLQCTPRTLHVPDVPGERVMATPVAQLGGLPVFSVVWPDTRLPNQTQKRSSYASLAPVHLEHLVCHITNDDRQAAFVWGRSQDSKRIELRTLPYEVDSPARTTIEQLAELHFEFHELGMFGPRITAVTDKLNRAFDVERVTKRFFKQFAEIFDRVETQIIGISDPERKRLFTQRLFNRLMFITFIQKKGWMSFKGQKNYLRALWEDYRRDPNPDETFYSARLQQLFFLCLDNPDGQDVIGINPSRATYFRERIGDVPFLNGGLFERKEEDANPAVTAPNDAISAILQDLFERFNFTVIESTPLNVEVAVDPEMLGKVFEELVTGRHDSGAYYTPKPIVSFMCREALKGYLKYKLPSEQPTAIDDFVDNHNSESVRSPEAVLETLRCVRVCDPACGSGAYLLGMMHELLDLRAALFKTVKRDHAEIYARKLDIIRNNLYGVDKDEFAVQIARLRLWLSLAVDYEGEKPETLPNLDFKIEKGDSLIAPSPEAAPPTEFRDNFIRQFHELKSRYITAHGNEKKALRTEIEGVREQIRLLTRQTVNKAGFDWQVEFAEVFMDGGGFDIIVANPPYVRQERIKDLKPDLQRVHPDVYTGIADLYVFFYSRALQLLKQGGMLAFISPNKWFRANYGAKLREHVASTCHINSITDFGDLPVFESATAYPMIFIAQKGGAPTEAIYFTEVDSLESPYPDVLAIIKQADNTLPDGAISGSEWRLTNSASANRSRSMRTIGTTLGEYVNGQIYRGILTGLNDAFYIDGATRARLIAKDRRSAEVIVPLAIGRDIKKWTIKSQDRWLILTKIGVDIRCYPAILEHLKQWQEKLEKRWDKGSYWWELRACAYYDAFDRPKIIYPQIMVTPNFAYDSTGIYTNQKCFIINNVDEYLLGVLNSASVWTMILEDSPGLRGGYAEPRKELVLSLPIPNAPAPDRIAIADLVQKCLDAKGIGCEEYEREIDERVARLYGIQIEEVKIGNTTQHQG